MRKDRYARTRHAALMAEFEGDLGIDHAARAKAVADQQRWIRIKTLIVWTIALMFFSIALQMLWHLEQLQRSDGALTLPFL